MVNIESRLFIVSIKQIAITGIDPEAMLPGNFQYVPCATVFYISIKKVQLLKLINRIV